MTVQAKRLIGTRHLFTASLKGAGQSNVNSISSKREKERHQQAMELHRK